MARLAANEKRLLQCRRFLYDQAAPDRLLGDQIEVPAIDDVLRALIGITLDEWLEQSRFDVEVERRDRSVSLDPVSYTHLTLPTNI